MVVRWSEQARAAQAEQQRSRTGQLLVATPTAMKLSDDVRSGRIKFTRVAEGFFVPSVPMTTGPHGHNVTSVDWVTTEPGEVFVRNVFASVLRNGSSCTRSKLVLDIGANEGYFGLLSAFWGCRTILFEPQPGCQTPIHGAILINGLSHVAELVPRPVSKTRFLMPVKQDHSCEGGFIGAGSTHRSLKRRALVRKTTVEPHSTITRVPSVSLEEVLRPEEHVELIKVDVEGGELSVLEDLLPFIRRRLVQNIVVEMTPGWWPRINATALLVEMEEFGMWAYTQNAPETRVPALKLAHFIRTRRRRPQQNVWFRRKDQ